MRRRGWIVLMALGMLAGACARERAAPAVPQPAPPLDGAERVAPVREERGASTTKGADPDAASGTPAREARRSPAAQSPSRQPGLTQLLPGLRVDVAARTVELDANVAIDARRRVFLEVLVCSPDTREHETILLTQVTSSQVHAALLAVGLEPGAPGSWRFEGTRAVATPPSGTRLDVLVRSVRDGVAREEPIAAWVISATDGSRLADREGEGFVFAGSGFAEVQGQRVYRADAEGTLVGLSAFGTETVAWTGMYHPDSDRFTPDWIADGQRVPARGEGVVVVIREAHP